MDRSGAGEAIAEVVQALGGLTRAIGHLIGVFTGGQQHEGPHLKGGHFMIIVKDTNPDVRYAVGGFTVVDAEGSTVPGAVVDVTVESDNPSAVAVTPDAPTPGSAAGSVKFGSPNPDGSPSQATVTAKVMLGAKVVGLFTETFAVTAGDPEAIVGGAMTFEGLTPAVESPAPAVPTEVTPAEPPA